MRHWSENQINNQICLTLLRHGATASNAEGRYLGKTDEALSPEGIRMLEKYVTAGNYPSADLLFCSPMKRCRETAQILYPGRIQVLVPEWTEMDFGTFEGHNYQELSGDPRYQQWIDSGGILPFPEGESRETFIRRSIAGYEKMLQSLKQICRETSEPGAEPGQQAKGAEPEAVSIVVHGGTLMALLSHFVGGEYFDYQVKCGRGYSGRLVFPAGEKEPVWKDFYPLPDLTKGEMLR